MNAQQGEVQPGEQLLQNTLDVWKGPSMIITGDDDPTVPTQVCRRAGGGRLQPNLQHQSGFSEAIDSETKNANTDVIRLDRTHSGLSQGGGSSISSGRCSRQLPNHQQQATFLKESVVRRKGKHRQEVKKGGGYQEPVMPSSAIC